MKKLFILYTLLFLLPLLQHNSGALHAQGSSGCYVSYKENLGLTEVVGLPELQAEACSLANALPTTFQSQFKVYSVAYYLYTPLMGDGTPPALAQYVAEIAALSPYYLIIAKENTPNALVNKFSIVLKLPDTEGFSCLTENDRSFFQRQLEIEAKSEYSQRGNLPSNYPFAEKKVVEQLKKYITKSLDCCAGGNKLPCESCSPCPDIPAATAIEDYFTNVLFKGDLPNIVKLPIVIDDCFDPTDPANSQTLSRVQTVKELPFKFREEDPGFGRIGAVVNSVLTSDYFEGVDPEKIKGFVTSNYVECSIADKEAFENIKNIFTPPPGGFAKSSTSYDYLVWCHIWQNPSSPTEGYLYIYGEIPGGRSPLETGGGFGEKVAKELAKSYLYQYDPTSYSSRFEQNATVVVFAAASRCYPDDLDVVDHIPDYSPGPLLNCINSTIIPTWLLSPAMQPVLIPESSIPDFLDNESASAYNYDAKAMSGFTTLTERWRGCTEATYNGNVKTGEIFKGYYNVTTFNIKRLYTPSSYIQNEYSVKVNGVATTPQTRVIEYRIYQSPASRPFDNYAQGSYVTDFDAPGNGLQPPSNPPIYTTYSLLPDLTASIKNLQNALKAAYYSPAHKGIMMQVETPGNVNNYTYYLVHLTDPNHIHSDAKWSIFNCVTGLWEDATNPFEVNSPGWGDYYIELNRALSTIHLSLGVLGMIPIFGEVFDAVDGMICYAEGDKVGAAISFGAAALPFVSPLIINGARKGFTIAKGAITDSRTALGRLNELYPDPALVNKVDEAAEAISKKEIKRILYYTNCGNKGASMQYRCITELPIEEMLEKAEALGKVETDEWIEFIDELNHKALNESDLTFLNAAGDAIRVNGPDMFHAWNAARKAGATLDLQQLTKLGEDITNTPGLAKEFGENPNLVKGWEKITTSINNTNGTLFSKDIKTLKKVTEMISEGSAFRNKFPNNWSSKLEEALSRNKHLNCDVCNGSFNRGPNMDEFLKDYEFIHLNFDETTDIGKRFHAWSKRKYLSGDDIPLNTGHISETHQTMNFIRKRNFKESEISKTDGVFNDDVNTSKRFDIELNTGSPRFIELKNKDYGSMQTLPASDADQVIGATGAFSTIKKIDDYDWVAYSRRFGDNANPEDVVNTLKNLWKPVFQARKTEVFNAMRPELKNSLFGPVQTPIQQQIFEDMIENLESNLYNFIKSE